MNDSFSQGGRSFGQLSAPVRDQLSKRRRRSPLRPSRTGPIDQLMRKCASCDYLLFGDGDHCNHCGAELPRVTAAAPAPAQTTTATAPAPSPAPTEPVIGSSWRDRLPSAPPPLPPPPRPPRGRPRGGGGRAGWPGPPPPLPGAPASPSRFAGAPSPLGSPLPPPGQQEVWRPPSQVAVTTPRKSAPVTRLAL